MRSTTRGRMIYHGYTLVELMVAMVGASALMVGLSSSIFIAFQATDISNTPASAMIEGNAALSDMLSDLEFAQSFTEITATAITFTVPDRNDDTVAETIRYAWSGTPGDPLTRQVNGGPVATLADNVHLFQHNIPTPQPNLLSNPDMELGTVNWEAIPGAIAYADWVTIHGGAQSLYTYRSNANSESGVRQDVTSQIANGLTYELSAWMMKWAASSPFDVRIQLRVTSTGDGEKIFSTGISLINNVDFRLTQGTVTPTWSGTLVSAYWEATGISKIQEIYVDDAVLRAKQLRKQIVNISLQVGGDPRSQIQSGVRLPNAPL